MTLFSICILGTRLLWQVDNCTKDPVDGKHDDDDDDDKKWLLWWWWDDKDDCYDDGRLIGEEQEVCQTTDFNSISEKSCPVMMMLVMMMTVMMTMMVMVMTMTVLKMKRVAEHQKVVCDSNSISEKSPTMMAA